MNFGGVALSNVGGNIAEGMVLRRDGMLQSAIAAKIIGGAVTSSIWKASIDVLHDSYSKNQDGYYLNNFGR